MEGALLGPYRNAGGMSIICRCVDGVKLREVQLTMLGACEGLLEGAAVACTVGAGVAPGIVGCCEGA